MVDYSEGELRDRNMAGHVVATSVQQLPLFDAISGEVNTKFFVNKRRHIYTLSINNKTGAPVTLQMIYGAAIVAVWTVPANTLPQMPPMIQDIKSPIFSIVGEPDKSINFRASAVDSVDVDASFYDEP